jgi:hypothetical protein
VWFEQCGRTDSNRHREHGVLESSPLNDDHRLLPGRGSNPRLPGNGRTSFRSTTWHGVSTATGSRTPLSGLRARCRDLWTIAAQAEAGRLERPRASRPLPVFGTGSSSSRITSIMEPSVGVAPTASSLPRTRSISLSYKGLISASVLPRRHDSNVRPPPSEGGALVLLSYGELRVDGRGRTCTLRFRRPAP